MRNKLFNIIFKSGDLANYYFKLFLKKLCTIQYFFYSGWVAVPFNKAGKNLSIIYLGYVVGVIKGFIG
jgi:hypothetical protein